VEQSVKKTVNKLKAALDQRTGPASKDQAAAPLADAIHDFWERGMLTFGIPTHNGGRVHGRSSRSGRAWTRRAATCR
jgi:hypothetical protein